MVGGPGANPWEKKLIPEINIIPGDGELPITVQFSVDLSTVPDSIVAFEWDLDNNGIIDSRLQNPEFTYSKAGIYSIRIKVFTLSSNVMPTDSHRPCMG